MHFLHIYFNKNLTLTATKQNHKPMHNMDLKLSLYMVHLGGRAMDQFFPPLSLSKKFKNKHVNTLYIHYTYYFLNYFTLEKYMQKNLKYRRGKIRKMIGLNLLLFITFWSLKGGFLHIGQIFHGYTTTEG